MYVIPQDGAHSGPMRPQSLPCPAEDMKRTRDASTQQPEDGSFGNVIDAAQGEPMRRQMRLATMIEPDSHRVFTWWNHDPIIELGSFTADQLIAQGMESLVEKFLLSILFGDRD